MDNKNKFLIILLAIVNGVVLFYLFFLGHYNILLLDDYGFADVVEREGVAGFAKDMYLTWQGRYGSFLISGLFFKIISLTNNLLIITILQLILGYGSVFLLLKYCFHTLNKGFLFLISMTVFNIAVLGLPEFNTFYWVCASVYVTFMPLTILLVYFCINKSISPYIAYPLIFILAFLIGGAAENYTPLVLFCLGCVLLYRWKKDGFRNLFRLKTNRRLVIAFVLLIIFFCLLLVAPGNKVRMEFEVIHPTGWKLFTKTCRALVDLFFMITPKMIYYILAFPLFYWVGGKLRKKASFLSVEPDWKYFAISFCFIFIVIFIGIMLGAYAVNEIAPLRSLCYMSFLLVAFCAYWGLLIGNKHYSEKMNNILMVTMSSVLLTLCVWRMSRDLGEAVYFHDEIEKRHIYLQELKKEGFQGITCLEPINEKRYPSSYAVFWNTVMDFYKPSKKTKHTYFPYESYILTEDPEEWRNLFLKNYLKLDFYVIMSPSCNEIVSD